MSHNRIIAIYGGTALYSSLEGKQLTKVWKSKADMYHDLLHNTYKSLPPEQKKLVAASVTPVAVWKPIPSNN